MEEFKHMFEYVSAAVTSVIGYFVWRYKKDINRIDEVDNRQQDMKELITHLQAQDTITKSELVLLKQQFIESRKELREDFKDIKDSISRLHERLDKK